MSLCSTTNNYVNRCNKQDNIDTTWCEIRTPEANATSNKMSEISSLSHSITYVDKTIWYKIVDYSRVHIKSKHQTCQIRLKANGMRMVEKTFQGGFRTLPTIQAGRCQYSSVYECQNSCKKGTISQIKRLQGWKRRCKSKIRWKMQKMVLFGPMLLRTVFPSRCPRPTW